MISSLDVGIGGAGRAASAEVVMLTSVAVGEMILGAWRGRFRWREEPCSCGGSDVKLPGDDWCPA